jgi:dUTPase
MAALDPLDPAAVFKEDKQRLVQLTAASLEPWLDVIVVAEMPTLTPPSARGEGGFGSTGI